MKIERPFWIHFTSLTSLTSLHFTHSLQSLTQFISLRFATSWKRGDAPGVKTAYILQHPPLLPLSSHPPKRTPTSTVREVYTQKPENRPTSGEFIFFGNPSTWQNFKNHKTFFFAQLYLYTK